MPPRFLASTERLYGVEGLSLIRRAHCVVVGIGGVGSWAVETLARTGVGKITLIDMDHIAPSNINRQVHALESTLGQSKIEAMQSRIAQINPDCEVVCVDDFVTQENWGSLSNTYCSDAFRDGESQLFGLIDACDQQSAKMAMALWANQLRSKPSPHFVTVGAAGGKRLLAPVECADLSLTTHDPLLAQIRYRLRKEHGYPKEGKKMGVACIFSREAVAKPMLNLPTDPDGAACAIKEFDHNLSCHGYGSGMAVTASFGIMAANFLINRIVSTQKTIKSGL